MIQAFINFYEPNLRQNLKLLIHYLIVSLHLMIYIFFMFFYDKNFPIRILGTDFLQSINFLEDCLILLNFDRVSHHLT